MNQETLSIYDPFSPVQILGYIAFALGVCASLQRNELHMRLLMVAMTGFIVTHFIWLGALAAAMGSLIAGTRTCLSMFEVFRKRALYFSGFFMILTLTVGVMTYTRPLDILTILAVMTGHYVFFNMKGLPLRYMMLVISLIWLAHNVLAYSYGPAMMECLIIFANLITIYRLRSGANAQPILRA
jgi:hypothetical protein